MKIAILEQQPISTLELRRHGLPHMFPDAEIVAVPPEEILESMSMMKDFHMLVLGGIVGEDSPYPTIFTPQRAEILENYLLQGGIVWAECAATYHLTRFYSYITSTGQFKEKDGLELIPGSATGPAFPHHTTPSGGRTLTVATIFNPAATEGFSSYQALDINGPALHLDPDASVIETLRYGNAPGQPVCGVIKSHGTGLLMAFSFHAAIPFGHLSGNQNAEEANRLLFLAHQANRIHAHINIRRLACE
ncbi:MAG: hypothetical protein JNL76_00105 [Alphaproteobacteria bacterium]|nr:hypothetical protein [Alphaproteobacteria bacterium]